MSGGRRIRIQQQEPTTRNNNNIDNRKELASIPTPQTHNDTQMYLRETPHSHTPAHSTQMHVYLTSQPRRQPHEQRTHPPTPTTNCHATYLVGRLLFFQGQHSTVSSRGVHLRPFGCSGWMRAAALHAPPSSVPKTPSSSLDTRITAVPISPESCRSAAPCRVLGPLQAHHCDSTDTRLSLSMLPHHQAPLRRTPRRQNASTCVDMRWGRGRLISLNSTLIKCLSSPKAPAQRKRMFRFRLPTRRRLARHGKAGGSGDLAGTPRPTDPLPDTARRRPCTYCLCTKILAWPSYGVQYYPSCSLCPPSFPFSRRAARGITLLHSPTRRPQTADTAYARRPTETGPGRTSVPCLRSKFAGGIPVSKPLSIGHCCT